MTGRSFPEITPLEIGQFTFAADEPWPGELGVVVAYAIRRREGVLLFDTDFGFRVLATSGHSTGHQSLVVAQPDGPVVLSGQAIYGLDEWTGSRGGRGRSTAPDRTAYDASVARIRAIEPSRVLFAHDRRPWSR